MHRTWPPYIILQQLYALYTYIVQLIIMRVIGIIRFVRVLINYSWSFIYLKNPKSLERNDTIQ